jgi:signal peptidase I
LQQEEPTGMNDFSSTNNLSSQNIPTPVSNGTNPRKEIWKSYLADVGQTILVSIALFLIVNAVSARVRIESISMQPTLYEGDFVFVNRLSYKLGEPGRGDVIVFRYPPNPDEDPFIKRVIGLPGDEVTVKNGHVLVNNIVIREPYIKASPAYSGTWRVPDNQLFVLGDNRNNSSDSHMWGMVPRDHVIGKAEVVYLPYKHWQVLSPRIAAAAGP